GFVLPLTAAAVALVISLFELGRPSYWLDEAATVSAMRRPLPDLLRVFQDMDLVHAGYYLVLWPWAHVFGTGETALRLPSALVTALAAAGVTVLGRRCAGKTAGLASGLVYASMVSVTRYAQEARSYAMVGAVAVLASYLLVRGLGADEGAAGGAGGDDATSKRRRWPWFAGYALAVALLGLLNLEALLLVLAHLVTLAFSRAGRGIWVRWLLAAAGAGVALAPFALAASRQDKQIDWLPKPGGLMLWRLVKFFAGDARLAVPVLGLALLGALIAWRRESAVSLTALALPWFLLPSVVLLSWSAVGEPVFIFRYVFFSLPGLALLVGAGLARLWRTGLRTSG
ncbi:glycosyltransferase family 39 protein, partial [Spirillospora sp. NPDC049652]